MKLETTGHGIAETTILGTTRFGSLETTKPGNTETTGLDRLETTGIGTTRFGNAKTTRLGTIGLVG